MLYIKYLSLLTSLLGALLMFIDKRAAIKRKHRIDEKTFYILSLLGGWIGITLMGLLINHKIAKKSFILKFMICVLVNVAMIYGLTIII